MKNEGEYLWAVVGKLMSWCVGNWKLGKRKERVRLIDVVGFLSLNKHNY